MVIGKPIVYNYKYVNSDPISRIKKRVYKEFTVSYNNSHLRLFAYFLSKTNAF